MGAIKEVAGATYSNNETVQGAFREANSSVYPNGSLGASTDPFAGKTNKYAESPLVRITTLDKAVHYIWSAAGTAATTSHDVIPANTSRLMAVDKAKAYLRIIENAASATTVTTELY